MKWNGLNNVNLSLSVSPKKKSVNGKPNNVPSCSWTTARRSPWVSNRPKSLVLFFVFFVFSPYRLWRTLLYHRRPLPSPPLLPRSSWLPRPVPGAQRLPSRLCTPPKNRQERWLKNHFRLDKRAIADTLTAMVTRTRLAAPSADLHLWGVGGGKRRWAALSQRGHRVPPREWSRGESGDGGGVRSGRGRLGADSGESPSAFGNERDGWVIGEWRPVTNRVRAHVRSNWEKCRARFVNND